MKVRFTIATAMGFVALFAAVFAGVKQDWLQGVQFLLVVVALWIAVMLTTAIVWDGEVRAACAGFSIFATVYMALAYPALWTEDSRSGSLPTIDWYINVAETLEPAPPRPSPYRSANDEGQTAKWNAYGARAKPSAAAALTDGVGVRSDWCKRRAWTAQCAKSG